MGPGVMAAGVVARDARDGRGEDKCGCGDKGEGIGIKGEGIGINGEGVEGIGSDDDVKVIAGADNV